MKNFVTIKLHIPKTKLLLETMRQYNQAVSYISNKGFDTNTWNRYNLHHLCYYEARKIFKLPSQFIINANRVASQTLKSIRKKKASRPIFKEYLPLSFDKRTFSFYYDKVRLTTINGRIDIPIEIPEYYWKYLDWNPQTANVILDRKGIMFIHITFSRAIKIIKSQGRLGVDVGINHIAVTSDRKFFTGSKIKNYRIKFKRLRTKLQVKGTRSAERLLKKISGRERRFKAWVNHNISKRIVSSCSAGTIVLENLKGIRNIRKGRRFNFWLNGWSFYQLHSFIAYKAARRGISIVKVNPFNTSKRCSKCGSIGTRSHGSFFCHCGYSLNADLNASFNLAKYHSMSDDVSVAVTQPNIQSDDVKGRLTTATELMDKSH
ncbi:RNA-guided endonuclease InsQ/TnpB family protein [Nanoarchaeota archaeon]